MELRDILKNLSKHKKSLVLATILGITVGTLLYFIPKKYSATGSLYVKRKVDETEIEFFTYGGYYSQQTALSYTNTAISLLESTDIRKKTLEKMGVEISNQSLKGLKKSTKITKPGPQLITVTVKADSENEAQNIWVYITDSLIGTSNELNRNGDANIFVSKVLPLPVVGQLYLPFFIYPLSGGLMFLLFGTFLTSLKEYLS